MRLWTMAVRNLGRNRRRSLLAGLSVLISILLILFMNGLMSGMMGSIVKNFTKNDVGHLNIVTDGYRARERFMPVTEGIPDSAEVVGIVEAIPELKGRLLNTAERIRFGVLLSSGPNSKAALGIAGDPVTERSMLMLDRSVLPGGSYLTGPGQAILGEALARDLGLGVGDVLKVVTQKADYGLGFKRFTVAGIFKTNVNALDNAVFQIGIRDARELLGMGDGAQQVLVMLKNYREADRVEALIDAALKKAGRDGLSVHSWTRMGDYPRFVRMAEGIYMYMYVVVAFLGAFIITNIMMMVVLERRKEIGILKSMGMPKGDILKLFLLEGTLLGMAGSAVGVVLGLGMNFALSKVGMDFSRSMAGFDWPMDNIVYPAVNPAMGLAFFALGSIVAATVSLLPSRSAARMNPIDAIRSV
ncbi:MAG TPA: FtsX-like permease family protein [Spirochaetia bacterium]|nr:FtsX-like permease family protein [Spirochaetales bacterium]HRY81390.1 FtsX-like permease family protein [Spirochaetia bacterium]